MPSSRNHSEQLSAMKALVICCNDAVEAVFIGTEQQAEEHIIALSDAHWQKVKFTGAANGLKNYTEYRQRYYWHTHDAPICLGTAEIDLVRKINDALLAAKRLHDEALPKFNWGQSCLDADAISTLNTTPGIVNEAINVLFPLVDALDSEKDTDEPVPA